MAIDTQEIIQTFTCDICGTKHIRHQQSLPDGTRKEIVSEGIGWAVVKIQHIRTGDEKCYLVCCGNCVLKAYVKDM